MPMFFLKDEKNIDMEEPYSSINIFFDNLPECGLEDNMKFDIKIDNKEKHGFSNGFFFNKDYIKSITLSFKFYNNFQARDNEEQWIIFHKLTYNFNPAFISAHRVFLEKISQISEYLFYEHAKYNEFSYSIQDGDKVTMSFIALASEEHARIVCKQMVAQDIALLCRGFGS